ncbi:MAG: DMT family transporter [Bacillota bacterium]|nr:DMT family transporter [Bacillota bacterium]
MRHLPNNTNIAVLSLLFISVIWGVHFAILKIMLETLPPLWMTALRYGGAALLLAVVLNRRLRTIDRPMLAGSLPMLLFLVAGILIQAVGLQFTAAGNASFILSTYVVLTPFVAYFFGKKLLGANIWVALVTLFGLFLFSYDPSSTLTKGDAMMLAVSVFWALHITFLGQVVQKHDPLIIGFLQVAAACVCSLAGALLLEELPPLAAATPRLLWSLLYSVVLATALGFIIQPWAQKYVAAAPAAVLMMSQSVFGAVAGWVMLNEMFSTRQYIGAAVILLSIGASILINTRHAAKKPAAAEN